MSAHARQPFVASPRLRLVPPMQSRDADESPEPTPIALHRATRVKNTIRCRNELCKLPLVEIRYNGTYYPLHAFPIRHVRGTSILLCECPACETLREVVLR